MLSINRFHSESSRALAGARLFGVATFFAVFGLFFSTGKAFAAGGIPVFIDYYTILLHGLGLSHEEIKIWAPLVGSLFATLLLVVIGLVFSARVNSLLAANGDLTPEAGFSLRTVVEMVMEFLHGLCRESLGSHWKEHLTLISGLFWFILIANLTGLVPGFPPPTANMGVNFSLGIIVFLVYNYAGIREHGAGYIKHFLGPVMWIAPLIFVVEMISHLVRPISLSMRLLINIFADHLILGVATGITWLVVPAAMLFFGLLVCVVQSYVFALLTATYVSMATSHDH